ncbi:hypothetical protein QR77_05625 [Streptomyces sp. 150FB]|nr:hypothetical protein QR77_05625 [Streptomyces sp. 150FB]
MSRHRWGVRDCGGIDPLNFAAGQRPVLGDLDQPRPFELTEVVVEPVSRKPGTVGKLTRGLRRNPHKRAGHGGGLFI